MLFKNPINLKVGIIVCIPCYYEFAIMQTLHSLLKGTPPKNCHVEVIVLINEPENAPNQISVQNNKTYKEIKQLQEKTASPRVQILVAYKKLNAKIAGVGLARKICMDEAFRRLSSINKTKEGIIVSLDADTICAKNYLVAIEDFYIKNPKTTGTSIYFEHPNNSPINSKEERNAIVLYELYLRYFVNFLRWCGHPHAFHTIGSAFSVIADIYNRQGGMKKRQAGEDFYFLHKIIPLGEFRELNTTAVYPSARISEKVPFGTGQSIKKIICLREYKVYNPFAFKEIKTFLNKPITFYKVSCDKIAKKLTKFPIYMQAYFYKVKLVGKLDEINKNCTSVTTFKKKFFVKFSIFFWIKYLNYLHPNYLNKIDVSIATIELLQTLGKWDKETCPKDLLLNLRKLDKSSDYKIN